jgi:type I restriction enzyme, R subunit
MTNFQFLKNEWPSMYDAVTKAEERVFTEPISTAGYCRIVLEESVFKIYEYECLEVPFNRELANLLNDEQIKAIIPYEMREGLRIVRKTGNNAVHFGNRVNGKEALISIKYLYRFLKWFVNSYAEEAQELPGLFDESFIPKIGTAQRLQKEQQAEFERREQALNDKIAALLEDKEARLNKAAESEETLHEYKEEVATKVEKLTVQKQKRQKEIPAEFTEAETRKHLIDVDLKEAGWLKLNEGRELEYPVHGMPITNDNPKGNGFVDYVLWDDNGLPLALIEAKRTSKDIEIGKHQAFLYANCLEKIHGQRPVIFYTNGYDTKIWDDTFYSAPRRVHGFYTKEELQWSIQQRKTRKDLRKAVINTSISGRSYQMEAIKRVADAFVVDAENSFRGNRRRALLVMATGSGKTRTAAALTDVLFKNNWVKRVLFLADRNALVKQAKDNFNEHLPELSSIDLTSEKENDTTRLVFSTYPSMMNKIDSFRSRDGRFYGVGHFDLIIVDEAHRSIYNRYKAIFDYFDAAVVGLTATPKDGIDHNTFELFGCSNEDPTFLYELEEAVQAKYLVPYRNITITTNFLRDGIKYKDLSDADKSKYEETFEDRATGLLPDQIRANALNKWLFNKDTVNKVLDTLMEKGLKIEGGDKIGRTLIFAVNQKHAKFIEECFVERYPEYPSGFIATIHNQVSHAQSLIDSFCDKYKENLPQIAVSVDMMDTGVDAPRVLNLLFFKAVRSYAKFWQMIGRGTRLCEDVFGPDMPKEYFLIFDVCGNFEFFDAQKKGDNTKMPKPLTQQIFESRLHLSRLLCDTRDIEDAELAKQLMDILHFEISQLDKNRFQVKMHLRYVEEFSKRERWNNLNADDVHSIEEHLSFLPSPEIVNELARRFDLMMLKLQISRLLMASSHKKYEGYLMEIAEGLSTKYTIPAVKRSQPLIEQLRDDDFYKELTNKKLEEIRLEIRELVQYLDLANRPAVYTDIVDSEIEIGESQELDDHSNLRNYGVQYRKRVENFILKHKDALVIKKLSNNEPITVEELTFLENMLFDNDDLGTREDYIKEFGEAPLGVFIRSIVGLDIKAAQEAFSELLTTTNLTTDQITFIQKIISFLTKNGTLETEMLFEPPFTDQNQEGLIGIFDDSEASRIIQIVEGINGNAGMG